MRILFTGGGTGGHFFPIIAVAREIKRLAEEKRILDIQLYYIGPDDFASNDLKDEEILSFTIWSGKVRRYFSVRNALDSVKLAIGIVHALWKLFIIMPDVIFSKGGYGAIPTLIAGRMFRIPIVIHDSDAIPGVVTQWSAKFAKRIAISYASAAKFFSREKIALTGTPIRKRTLGGNPDEARELLGVYSKDPILFFIGGSQGAQKINDAIIGILPELLKKYEVIHQAGKANYEDVRLETRTVEEKTPKGKYHPIAFLSEPQLRAAYTIADFVVSRASSGIFEIAAAGKPSILIPIKKSAQDHQRENAYQYAKTGAAIVVEEDNLTPHLLLNEIEKLMGDRGRLQKMSEEAQKFARVDAATLIADEVLKLGIHN